MNRAAPVSPRLAALSIVRTLRRAGFTALFAGGCVRDALLGRRPDDYDVATDARPEQILSLFRRTRKVGVQFGVVMVGVGGRWIEVATFRSDTAYSDGRHPDAVCFSDPLHDAQRRDFTINGMFYDPIARRVIDHVGARRDLRDGVIRAIGDPAARFAEDHLRMLRAVRFAARLGFRIDPRTLEAIGRYADRIARVSPERIADELERILTHPRRAAGWRLLEHSGLLPHLWPIAARLPPHSRETAARLAALPRRPISWELALASILLPLEMADVRASCRQLRTSNDVQADVAWLCAHVEAACSPRSLSLADVKRLMAGRRFDDLLLLVGAHLRARRRSPTPRRELAVRARAVSPDAVSPPPLVNGDDLHAWGVPQGPIYRKVLNRVYDEQLNERIRDRRAARELAARTLAEMGIPVRITSES